MKTPQATVICEKHGRELFPKGPREVRVPMPSTKRERMSGCPACRSEKKREVVLAL